MLNIRFQRFEKLNVFLIVFCAIGFLLFFPVAGQVDQYLSKPWVGSEEKYTFEENWYLVHFGHQGLKYIAIAIATIHLIILIYLKIYQKYPQLQRICVFVLISMICSVSVIAILKSLSMHACPWSMVQQVNGVIDWNRVLTSHGKCLPGGHASGGFALLALFFAYRKDYPRFAFYSLVFALVLGSAMSIVQMIRGAHFLSHNLWSFWWSWSIDFMVYLGLNKYWTLKNSHQN